MTKEKLYDELANIETEYGLSSTDVNSILEEFFESNVCIPKGENRHPYADIFHLMLEDGHNLEPSQDTGWYAFKTYNENPIYEWQYACINEEGKEYITGFYAPSVEAIPCDGILLEETKRIRK